LLLPFSFDMTTPIDPALPGHHTLAELLSQPDAWRAALAAISSAAEALRALWRTGYARVIFTGCGSPYYAAQAAAAQLREAGIDASALPGSEIWLNAAALPSNGRTLLVALSRSGETTELLRACAAFDARRIGDIVTMSCYPDAALARAGALNIVLPSGQEHSFAQTRAFTCLYLAAICLGPIVRNDSALLAKLAQLPDACADLLSAQHDALRAIGGGAGLERFYFLGSGARYGLASELSLKMKEMSISHSEPFHFLEFRHGPQTMVNAHTLVIGLVSDTAAAHEFAVLDDMRALGARVLSLGAAGACDIRLGGSSIDDAARGPLYVVAGQVLAHARALANGRNPDRPHNLHAVVKLA
jgi:glutamine---fructose-6-phosphate transaminase (isomerizing)